MGSYLDNRVRAINGRVVSVSLNNRLRDIEGNNMLKLIIRRGDTDYEVGFPTKMIGLDIIPVQLALTDRNVRYRMERELDSEPPGVVTEYYELELLDGPLKGYRYDSEVLS